MIVDIFIFAFGLFIIIIFHIGYKDIENNGFEWDYIEIRFKKSKTKKCKYYNDK